RGYPMGGIAAALPPKECQKPFPHPRSARSGSACNRVATRQKGSRNTRSLGAGKWEAAFDLQGSKLVELRFRSKISHTLIHLGQRPAGVAAKTHSFVLTAVIARLGIKETDRMHKHRVPESKSEILQRI